METGTAAPPKAALAPYKLPSGAVLYLGSIQFRRADALKKALMRAFTAAPLSPGEMKVSLETIRANPSAGGALLQRLLTVVASDEVDAAVFACLQGAGLYQPKGSQDRLPVEEALFDNDRFGQDARADQVQIWVHVGVAAVKPFLGALLSLYTAYQKKAGPSQESSLKSSPAAS